MPDFYGTAVGYKEYHEARGRVIDPEDADVEIESGLLVASEWLDGRFGPLFGGLKTNGRVQVREFPRSGLWDIYGYQIQSNEIPREIENATYEAAFRQLLVPGSLIVDYTPGKYKSVSVEGAVSVDFANFSSGSDAQTQYLAIDAILYPLLAGYYGILNSPLSGSVMRV